MRLVRLVLTENIVLAALAAGVGLLLAGLVLDALSTWAAAALPRLENVQLDVTAFLFALTISLLCGLVAGVLPALQLSTMNPVERLRDGIARPVLGSRRVRRVRHGLVVAELALAVVLLAGAGVLIRSFLRVHGHRPRVRLAACAAVAGGPRFPLRRPAGGRILPSRASTHTGAAGHRRRRRDQQLFHFPAAGPPGQPGGKGHRARRTIRRRL